MKVLLTTLNAKYIHTNLAIRLLYEMNAGYEGLDWKEFVIKEDRQKVAAYCASYDVVAFSCYIWNISQTLETAKLIKALHPETRILLGGPEVSYDGEALMALPYVDYIIEGEGETPFREFLKSYPQIEHVPALVYRSEHGVQKNKQAPMFDLKQFEHSMPYRYDDVSKLADKVLYIETSRGCPYKCEFCLASLDNKVRYLPDSSIKATLMHLMTHGKVIKFLDRTFNIKKDFTIGMFQFIQEHHRPGNVFQFEITADILHPDIIRFIQDHVPAGLLRFEIGIQTVNQKANLEVSRKQNFEKTKQIIRQLDHKVEMHLDLIVGLAYDYWDDVKYSIEEVFALFAPEMQLGFLKFLKGTPMRDKTDVHGFVFDTSPPYQIIESKYLSRAELAKIVQLEHALEIYWNGKKCINTLKYVAQRYSIFDFLLGLGIRFGEMSDYHHYSLDDIFTIIRSYSSDAYPNDMVLRELITIDYYLHFKVKPKALFSGEVEASERQKIIRRHNLSPKYRYVILSVNFDYAHFLQQGFIQNQHSQVVIEYNGISKARVVAIPTDQG